VYVHIDITHLDCDLLPAGRRMMSPFVGLHALSFQLVRIAKGRKRAGPNAT
jgi:hypothetical protein